MGKQSQNCFGVTVLGLMATLTVACAQGTPTTARGNGPTPAPANDASKSTVDGEALALASANNAMIDQKTAESARDFAARLRDLGRRINAATARDEILCLNFKNALQKLTALPGVDLSKLNCAQAARDRVLEMVRTAHAKVHHLRREIREDQGRISGLNLRLARLHRDAVSDAAEVKRFNEEIKDINDLIAADGTKVTGLKSDVTYLNAQLVELAQQQLSQALRDVLEQQYKADLRGDEAEIKRLSDKVDKLKESLASWTARLTHLQADMASDAAKEPSLKADLEKAKADLAEDEAALKVAQDDLDKQRRDLKDANDAVAAAAKALGFSVPEKPRLCVALGY